MTITLAAMRSRKNVSEITEASVANLMKSEEDPNENEAMRSAVKPFDRGNGSINPRALIDVEL
jgi:hypothetical protein